MASNSDGYQFVGAAQTQASTLQKLATDTLDMSWPNWKNYQNPELCLIPPIFSYTNSDKSDQQIQDGGKKNQTTGRRSEWAEHIVYKAIWASAQKHLPGPILVVHSFNLDRIRHHLPHVFTNVQIDQNDPFIREYDFVLIGPKIGLIVIEVKSSEFSGQSDFKSKHLPNDYTHGIKQLQYFAENFLNFLQECTGIKWPTESPVRRILFMPNLERARHEMWLDSQQERYEKAEPGTFDHMDAHTIKWYKEDLDNGEPYEQETKLLKTVSKLLLAEPDQQIPKETYESYASIIAGLGTLIVFKNQSKTKLDPLKLFEKEALIREAARIETQDFGGQLLKKGKANVETLNHFSKVLLPTRQQLEALKGPKRQFILAPAGCGKTVVLQEKALQLLRNGLKVLIVAPDMFISRYKELFDSNRLNCYEVRPLDDIANKFPHENLGDKVFLESYKKRTDPVEDTCEYLKRCQDENSEEWNYLKDYFDYWIEDFDAILIDDAIDEREVFILPTTDFDHWNYLAIELAIMVYTEMNFPDKTLWIALDPLMIYFDDNHSRSDWTFGQVFGKCNDQKWSCSFLDKVMRSSENIFQLVYGNNVLAIPELKMRPSIGHKVVGPEVIEHRHASNAFTLYTNETHAFWTSTKLELDRLQAQQIPLGYISIIIGGSLSCKYHLMRILTEQLRECGIPFTSLQGFYAGKNDQHDGNTMVRESLSIGYYDRVSSHEWPIVIYVEADDNGGLHSPEKKQTYLMFQRYLAYTRATTKLVLITVFYDFGDMDRRMLKRQKNRRKKVALRCWIRNKLRCLQFWKRREY